MSMADKGLQSSQRADIAELGDPLTEASGPCNVCGRWTETRLMLDDFSIFACDYCVEHWDGYPTQAWCEEQLRLIVQDARLQLNTLLRLAQLPTERKAETIRAMLRLRWLEESVAGLLRRHIDDGHYTEADVKALMKDFLDGKTRPSTYKPSIGGMIEEMEELVNNSPSTAREQRVVRLLGRILREFEQTRVRDAQRHGLEDLRQQAQGRQYVCGNPNG